MRLRTREAILDTVLSLYGHSGYSGVTIRALGKEMGLKAPSLYHYFDSKEEMFVCLQKRALELQERFMIRDLTDEPVADVELFFNRYIEFAQAHPEYFTLLYIDPAVPADCRERVWSEGDEWLRQVGLQLIQRCVDGGALSQGDRRSESVDSALARRARRRCDSQSRSSRGSWSW